MSRKHSSPKRIARKAMRQARRQQLAWRRDRDRALSAADRVTREFNIAGTARRARDERSP